MSTRPTSRLRKKPGFEGDILMRAAMTDGVMGRDLRRRRGIGDGFGSSSLLRADSSRCGQDFRDANEIIGGRGQYEEPFHQAAAAMSGFA